MPDSRNWPYTAHGQERSYPGASAYVASSFPHTNHSSVQDMHGYQSTRHVAFDAYTESGVRMPSPPSPLDFQESWLDSRRHSYPNYLPQREYLADAPRHSSDPVVPSLQYPMSSSGMTGMGHAGRQRQDITGIPGFAVPMSSFDTAAIASDASSSDLLFKPTQPPRLRTAHACEKCRIRKAKCSGDRVACKRCLTRGLVCVYTTEGRRSRVRGPARSKTNEDASSANAASADVTSEGEGKRSPASSAVSHDGGRISPSTSSDPSMFTRPRDLGQPYDFSVDRPSLSPVSTQSQTALDDYDHSGLDQGFRYMSPFLDPSNFPSYSDGRPASAPHSVQQRYWRQETHRGSSSFGDNRSRPTDGYAGNQLRLQIGVDTSSSSSEPRMQRGYHGTDTSGAFSPLDVFPSYRQYPNSESSHPLPHSHTDSHSPPERRLKLLLTPTRSESSSQPPSSNSMAFSEGLPFR